jgi:hypothetical protein
MLVDTNLMAPGHRHGMSTKTARTMTSCGLLSALLCTGCPIGYNSIGGDSSESGDSTGTGTGQEDGPLGIDAGDPEGLPEAPELALSLSQVKQFDFEWAEASGAEFYQLLESADTGESFVPVGEQVLDLQTSLTVPLHFRLNASYKLLACNDNGCSESNVVEVAGPLVEAIGYVKAADTGVSDFFGSSVSLSGDGRTLAVGAYQADSNAGEDAGAVYVFVRDDQDAWSQQARIEAGNADANDRFGISVSLSGDGDTLAVGAYQEASSATGIGGDQANDSAADAGAVYVFARDGQDAWSQSAYVKASNTDAGDYFGWSVAVSGDGDTLAVGALAEGSSATGIGGDETDDSIFNGGAVYVFTHAGQNVWSQQAYIKSSNTDEADSFGGAVALSSDGNTLAVGAAGEDSGATGIGGDQVDNTVYNAGAAYVFVRDGQSAWSQTAYVKASNPDVEDIFGSSVALSGDGETLAVGTDWEDSSAAGIGGDDADDQAENAGAVYVFVNKNAWLPEAYIKSSNPGENDYFGHSLALSSDGDTLAVGAPVEDSGAIGIGGDQQDDAASNGATYVFVRDGAWSQVTYVKAANAGMGDAFGYGVALSSDGDTLAVGAYAEDSNATGIGGDSLDESSLESGAVYLY